MKRYDWKRILRTNIIKLKIVGLWPSGDDSYKPNIYTLWAISSIIFLNFGHNFFQMVNMIFIFDNLHAVIKTTYVTLSEVAGLLKAYYVVRNMKTLKELMVTLSSDTFQPKNARQIKMVKPSFLLLEGQLRHVLVHERRRDFLLVGLPHSRQVYQRVPFTVFGVVPVVHQSVAHVRVNVFVPDFRTALHRNHCDQC
jgi:hypothetical protein